MTQYISKKDLEILEDLINVYGGDAVLNEIQFSKKNVIGGLASLALGMGMGLHDANKSADTTVLDTPVEKKEVVVKQNKPSNPYGMSKGDYELFQKKTEALRNEIQRVFEKRNIPMDRLKFSPEHMVYMSYLYDFDLPLMISQSRLETCFGTEGVGSKCNSLFSIGAHDKNPTRVKYSSLDDSVEPYIKTVKYNYLLDGKKSVDDLLSNGYVNGAGNRYASNTEYEKKLRQIRDSLIKTYPVMAQNFRKD